MAAGAALLVVLGTSACGGGGAKVDPYYAAMDDAWGVADWGLSPDEITAGHATYEDMAREACGALWRGVNRGEDAESLITQAWRAIDPTDDIRAADALIITLDYRCDLEQSGGMKRKSEYPTELVTSN